MSRKIVFVCTGNTCRSPVAEGLFNLLAGQSGLDVRAVSCGIACVDTDGPVDFAIAAAAELGADISGHIPRPVCDEILSAGERVYCMTASQVRLLRAMFPEYADKVSGLSDADIPDPFGGDRKTYVRTAKVLYNEVKKLVEGLGSD